jgi:hypothetical protein
MLVGEGKIPGRIHGWYDSLDLTQSLGKFKAADDREIILLTLRASPYPSRTQRYEPSSPQEKLCLIDA